MRNSDPRFIDRPTQPRDPEPQRDEEWLVDMEMQEEYEAVEAAREC